MKDYFETMVRIINREMNRDPVVDIDCDNASHGRRRLTSFTLWLEDRDEGQVLFWRLDDWRSMGRDSEFDTVRPSKDRAGRISRVEDDGKVRLECACKQRVDISASKVDELMTTIYEGGLRHVTLGTVRRLLPGIGRTEAIG